MHQQKMISNNNFIDSTEKYEFNFKQRKENIEKANTILAEKNKISVCCEFCNQ